MTPARSIDSPPRRAAWTLPAGYAMAAVAVTAYLASGLFPGTAATVPVALGHFTAGFAGAVCLGGLVLILITARPDEAGILDPSAFRAHLVVERLALVWFGAAVPMVA
ncbi:MAG: cytochrome c oxidase assembly protein, partial [Mycobacterium sp.]|nr:cytochrome c oxidase assembly protein [Mycobacterium sp.]